MNDVVKNKIGEFVGGVGGKHSQELWSLWQEEALEACSGGAPGPALTQRQS